jgi:hypothetical protein
MPPKGKRVVKSSSPTKTKPQKTTSTQQKKSTPNNSAATPSNSSTTNIPSPEDTTATPPDDSSSFPNNNNSNAPNASSGIDEVLSEADQLLRAASEAQALGRLRNASTYLLLAHARLVGLGRRFDRSRIEIDNADEKKKIGDKLNENGGGTSEGGKNIKAADSTGAIDPLIQLGDQSNMSLLALPGGDSHHPNDTNDGGGNTAATANNNANNNNNEPMLFPHQTFHHMPDNGVAYVEHLARTAMELHHKRTGRGMQHDAMVEKQNAVTKAKQVEQEQIRLAARGLFATAKGFTGVNVATGSAVGGGETNSRGFEVMGPPTTRKRKATEAQIDTEEKNAMAKRKGGRGKKPPTLVMHTQYGKNSDVHDLMKGALLS